MAKKKKKPAEIPTVSVGSPGEVTKAATGAVSKIGNTAASTNVSGKSAQLGGILNLFSTGGATTLNTVLDKQYAALTASVGKAASKSSTALSKAQINLLNINSKIGGLQAKADAGTLSKKGAKTLANLTVKAGKVESKIGTLTGKLEGLSNMINVWEKENIQDAPKATELLANTFPELQQTADEADSFLDQLSKLGPAGEQLMQQLGQGYQAAPIVAREVEQSELGRSLMAEAERRVALNGQLDPQAARDAVQSARAAFSARGLGTGLGSAAAEMMNRDRYSRQRAFEDLGFAQTVDQMDLMRRTDNAGRSLQGGIANESNRLAGAGMNIGMLGDAYSTQQGLNQLGLTAALERGRLRSAANPNTMMLDLYNQGNPTGSESINAGANLASNWMQANLAAQGFNSNAIGAQILGAQNLQAARYAANATQNAGMMGMIGGIGGGALAGAGAAYGGYALAGVAI